MAASVTASSAWARNETCRAANDKEISSLFDRWNNSLQISDPHKVVANYAEKSVLLPTVSNKPRLTPAEKEDYFHHFLEKSQSAKSTPGPFPSTATPRWTTACTLSSSRTALR